MQPAKTKATTSLDPTPELLTFRKEGGTLLVTNNSKESSFLIFVTTSERLETTGTLAFKAGTIAIDLKNVVNITSFQVVSKVQYVFAEDRQKPCNQAICPIPPEPPIVSSFMVTPVDELLAGKIQRGR